jgi:hypothetical protein
MSQEFIVNTYGLALWLIARGIQPIKARCVRLNTVFVFPSEAGDHFEAFQTARKQLTEQQQAAGVERGAR